MCLHKCRCILIRHNKYYSISRYSLRVELLIRDILVYVAEYSKLMPQDIIPVYHFHIFFSILMSFAQSER
jgi:hypothetical protein